MAQRMTEKEKKAYDRGYKAGQEALQRYIKDLEFSLANVKSGFANQLSGEVTAREIARADSKMKDKWIQALSIALRAMLDATIEGEKK